MSFTIVLHGNDATGKSTLCKAIRDAGYSSYTRGDAHPDVDIGLKVLDELTLKLAIEKREKLLDSFTDSDGTQRRILRVMLDGDVANLQARIAKRPTSDEWETEKSLFYFRARFKELAAYYGIPIFRTDTKSVAETVTEIISYAKQPALHDLFETVALRNLTVEKIEDLAAQRIPQDSVDYTKRLEEILSTVCGDTSLFTPEDILKQCESDPGLRFALVNSYDGNASNTTLSFRLITEGESKQIYRVSTNLTTYFDDKVFVILKPTIYSHSKQATAEIDGLRGIRAAGSLLFLEMLHRAGINHTYEAINEHGIIIARKTDTTPIETVYKERCEGTDKHSFFGMRTDPDVVLESGEYRGGPYVRFDWRNPNHVYKGVNPATHPFYFLMEASVGKERFYTEFLTARAAPFGDKCVPEELVHGVQAVENSVEHTIMVFFTLQYYLNQIGLEVQDGCIMLDRKGDAMWSEINQDCMRIKRVEADTKGSGGEAFDKDMWRAGGSSAKDAILAKWKQLNDILGGHLAANPFHTNEMVTKAESYGLHARRVLEDQRLSLTPRYRSLYERLAAKTRLPLSPSNSKPESTSGKVLADMMHHCWQLVAASRDQQEELFAEMLGYLFSLIRSEGLDIASVTARLSARRQETECLSSISSLPKTFFRVGLTGDKYKQWTDEFITQQLGIQIRRRPGRSVLVDYDVVDQQKYRRYFGDLPVYFITIKPKDMPVSLANGFTDFVVTYNTVMDNFPRVATLLTSSKDEQLVLALISRANTVIDTSKWDVSNKARIATEHVCMVREHMTKMGVAENLYTLDHVLGSSESYLINDPAKTYILCDAVVSTGATLKDNDLEVWQVIKQKGELTVGLYGC